MIDIYTKVDCSYCMQAKAYMHKHRIAYNEHVIGRDLTREEFLEKFPQAKTVPLVFLDNRLLGGYINLVEHFGGENKRVVK